MGHSSHPLQTLFSLVQISSNTHLVPSKTLSFHSYLSLSSYSPGHTHTHAYLTIPIFPFTHTILDPHHPCSVTPHATLCDINIAHPSFPLPLYATSKPLQHTPPSNPSHNLLLPSLSFIQYPFPFI